VPARPAPDPANYPKFDLGECGKRDQISEGASDWFANEILPEYMEQFHKLTPAQYRDGYANVHGFICRDDSALMNDNHSSDGVRANAITMVHPKARLQMGCRKPAGDYRYCAEGGSAAVPAGAGGDADSETTK
jgi:hypothetical protein